MQFTSHYSKSLLLCLVLGATGARTATADTTSDLAFTAFPNADINSLADGKVMQARGGLIEFERGLTAQALYLIDAPVETVRQKLTTWNPASHSELKVWLHQPLPAKPTAADFNLSGLPDNSSVNYMIKETAKLDPAEPELQVDKNEAQMIASMHGGDGRAQALSAWSQVLAGRSARFLAGNFSTDHYIVSEGDITSLGEITHLLRSDALVYHRFHPLLANTPVYNSNRAKPVNMYYECFDIQGGGSLGTGAMYQSLTNGAPVPAAGTVLCADVEYYLNNGIYVSVELHQLSPVTVNGKSETLVWREDMVSTSNVAYLHGTERLASGMIMLQDVKQAVDAFRSEFK